MHARFLLLLNDMRTQAHVGQVHIDAPREEVTAGVTYQVTPRFRLGGGVTVKGNSVAESLSDPATRFGKEGAEASVRIESAFSF